MGRMLEAIRQIEEKGPPPAMGRIRPTPRRRIGRSDSSWPLTPDSSGDFPEIDEQPALIAPAPPEPLAIDSLADELAATIALVDPPTVAQPLMVATEVPMAPAPAAEEPPLDEAGPANHLQRVAAAMIACIPAFSSGVVAVASAESKLETTPISAALAHALVAGPKHEVLLIDARADRNPGRLAQYWGGMPGLQDVLRRQASWHDTVRPTTVQGLSILEAGTPGAAPGAEEWQFLWNDLKRRFRFILLDCGPAMSIGQWTSTLDAMYLVVELGKSSRWAAEQSARHLRGCGARLAGSLLLDAQMRL